MVLEDSEEDWNAVTPEKSKTQKMPGNFLLSRQLLASSIIGLKGLNYRVRNGNGCDPLSKATRQYLILPIVKTRTGFTVKPVGRLVPVS